MKPYRVTSTFRDARGRSLDLHVVFSGEAEDARGALAAAHAHMAARCAHLTKPGVVVDIISSTVQGPDGEAVTTTDYPDELGGDSASGLMGEVSAADLDRGRGGGPCGLQPSIFDGLKEGSEWDAIKKALETLTSPNDFLRQQWPAKTGGDSAGPDDSFPGDSGESGPDVHENTHRGDSCGTGGLVEPAGDRLFGSGAHAGQDGLLPTSRGRGDAGRGGPVAKTFALGNIGKLTVKQAETIRRHFNQAYTGHKSYLHHSVHDEASYDLAPGEVFISDQVFPKTWRKIGDMREFKIKIEGQARAPFVKHAPIYSNYNWNTY